MKIIINAIPPSLNKFAGRKNYWEYRKVKEEWKELVYYTCKQQKYETLNKAIVTVTYFFPTRARHDPDNFNSKWIMDGLTAAGVILDDSFDCIELRLRGGYDKVNPRTEIEVESEKQRSRPSRN
jgi:crossover junction endodeoxyribonuclease RusA